MNAGKSLDVVSAAADDAVKSFGKKKKLKMDCQEKKNKSNFYHTLLDTISLRASLLEKYLVGPL